MATSDTTARPHAQARPKAKEPHRQRTATLKLPFVTAQFRVPEVHMPRPRMPHPPVSGQEIKDMAGAVVSVLPPPDRLAYYAGLGALAAFEVIDWPVAAAIGVGTVVAQRVRSGKEWKPTQGTPSGRRSGAPEAAAAPGTAGASKARA